LVKIRTMQANGLRGILAEYGEVAGQGRASLAKTLPELLSRLSERLTAVPVESLREQFSKISRPAMLWRCGHCCRWMKLAHVEREHALSQERIESLPIPQPS
jgi:hypothetical protein